MLERRVWVEGAKYVIESNNHKVILLNTASWLFSFSSCLLGLFDFCPQILVFLETKEIVWFPVAWDQIVDRIGTEIT